MGLMGSLSPVVAHVSVMVDSAGHCRMACGALGGIPIARRRRLCLYRSLATMGESCFGSWSLMLPAACGGLEDVEKVLIRS
jgi:hypothetical protein